MTQSQRVCLLWFKVVCPLFSPLSSNLLREIASFLQCLPYPFWVTSESLQYFFVGSKQTVSVSLDMQVSVNANSRWAVAQADSVVVCGGGTGDFYTGKESWSTAYLIYTSGKVQSLPNMRIGRKSQGVVTYQGSVYAFGSIQGPGVSRCERLPLFPLHRQTGAWESIADMKKPRAYFTPVIWKKEIYLCGGYQNDTIEVCSGQLITLFSLQLPEAGKALSCVESRDSLVVMSSNYLTVISAEGKVKRNMHQCCFFVPVTSPVECEGVVYHSDNGKVQTYSSEDGNRLNIVYFAAAQ